MIQYEEQAGNRQYANMPKALSPGSVFHCVEALV